MVSEYKIIIVNVYKIVVVVAVEVAVELVMVVVVVKFITYFDNILLKTYIIKHCKSLTFILISMNFNYQMIYNTGFL